MSSRNGKSFVTFGKVISEGKESLIKWLSNVDNSIVADHILTLSDIGNTYKKDASDIEGKNFVKGLLGETEHSETADVKYKGIEIEIKNATVREYKTRSRGWTFNVIEIDKFDYILFIGHDNLADTSYWLMNKVQMNNVAPIKRDGQKINGKVGFSVGISSSRDSVSWKRYSKYLIDPNSLKTILDGSLN